MMYNIKSSNSYSELPSGQDATQFTKALERVGLKPTYWLNIFEKLEIDSVAALEFIEEDSDEYLELLKSARKKWERKALKKLLKFGDNKVEKVEDTLEEKRKEEKEKVKERQTKSVQVLKKLKTLCEQGKEHCHNEVQQVEKEICKQFHISHGSWKANTRSLSLQQVIGKLEVHQEEMIAMLQVKDEQSDNKVIKNASNGRALQGILLTGHLVDLLKDRNYLLKAPENIKLQAHSNSTDNSVEQFCTKSHENNYKKAVEVLGWGISETRMVSGQVHYGRVIIKPDVPTRGRNEQEQAHRGLKKQLYSSTVKYSSLKLAAFTFELRDLQLSTDAVDELRKIKKMVITRGPDSPHVQTACVTFFRNYGSHVCRGPLHYGGIYWWKCSSIGFNEHETSIVKKIQNDAVNTHAGVSFYGFGISKEVSITDIQSKYNGQCSEETLHQTHLNVNTTGGPPAIGGFPEWKSGLEANKKTWSLIDRGENLTAVWEIIAMNHGKELNRLVKVLKKSWETFTKLQAKQDVLTVSYRPELVIQEIMEIHLDQGLSLIEECLCYLVNVKSDLLYKSRNVQAWANTYLLQPALQNLLKSLTDQLKKVSASEMSLLHLKFLMQQIFEQKDERYMKLEAFPDKKILLEWLYNSKSQTQLLCKDLEGLLNYLKKLKQSYSMRAVSSGTDLHNCHKAVANNVTVAIHCIRLNIQSTSDPKRKYEEIFTITLVYPFMEENIIDSSPTSPVLLKPLSNSDMEYICRQFEEQISSFYTIKKNILKVQAYLFHLAITIYTSKQELNEQQLVQHLKYMQKMIGGEIQPQIAELLTAYETKACNFKLTNLQENLTKLLTTQLTSQHEHESYHCNSLLEVLRSAKPPLYHRNKPSVQYMTVYGKTEVERLFTILGLSMHFPKKLTLRDALCIRHSSHSKYPYSSQLYCLILQKIMSHDYLCRSDFLQRDSDSSDESSFSNESVHPLDGLLALFHCADDILRQDIMCRLATCQLGIPLILPDPFTDQLALPMWTMQSIIKEWKHMTESGVKEEECPIITYPTSIISFLRIGGNKSKSKSKLINEVISDTHFDHFFHRDCDGGRIKRLLCDGLVEIHWYLPGENTTNIFPDALTFLNLHGDASKHFSQMVLLSQISSICFVLLSNDEMDNKSIEILKQFSLVPGGVVLLAESNAIYPKVKAAVPDFSCIDLSEGDSEIKKKIRKYINGRLPSLESLKCVEDYSDLIRYNDVWEVREIKIDEGNESFKRGLELSTLLQGLKHTDKTIGVKQAMLPLQSGKLWQKWAKLDKEKHRQLERGPHASPYEYAIRIENQQQAIRSDQLQHVDHLTPVMKSFLITLLSQDWTTKQYFLQCLKLGLDNSSRKIISELQHDYQQSRAVLATSQLDGKAQESDKNILICKKTVEEMYEKFSSASFGLEHLLRELGQVYEAALQQSQRYAPQLPKVANVRNFTPISKNNSAQLTHQRQNIIFRLPQLAAQLLINGYPLEVMDGDAAHVPIEWVKTIIGEVAKERRDPRVFVLSILGLQSTGKSTMLNTCFGLQFNVGAGRCTRGAYMQLLPIGKELREEVNCDFVLVIDTEGLRAPELDSEQTQKHDNELAAFVIGLANVTLINIYGEVPGDMDDILQTTIHAFIRMKKVNLKPSCQFVHQNANNSSKGEVGRQRFVEKLNKMTFEAAKEEKCENKFTKFSDVIAFNDQKDVHYFPGLWMGEPPMAPVNRGYSKSACRLKSHLVGLMQTNAITLSTFESRLDDLWDALLHEDFVFSFKNTLEVTAYNSLEAQYNKWDWEFQKAMMTWEQEMENELDGVEVYSIAGKVNEKVRVLEEYVTDTHDNLKSEMASYFKQSKNSDMLVQWKATFEIRLHNLATNLKQHAESVCKELCSGRQAMDEIKIDEQHSHRSWIIKKVNKIIAEMKADQEKLKDNLEKNQLSKEQSKDILDLLSPGQLEEYQRLEVLTTQQIHDLYKYRPLTEEKLRSILLRKIISTEQISRILERGLSTEEQLQEKFDMKWTKLLNKLPNVQEENINVEMEVQRKLFDHAGRKRKDKLIKKLKYKQLKMWGSCDELEFTVEQKHVKMTSSKKVGLDKVMNRAQDSSDDILAIAQEYLTDTCGSVASTNQIQQRKKPTNFKPSFTQELLRVVDDAISEESHMSEFTEDYTEDLYLTVCGYAVKQFEKMVEAFRRQNNPRVYLQDEKEFLFTLFKNQHYQLALEKAFASTLCERLEKVILLQVPFNLGKTLIDDMKKTDQCFDSKSTLKAKILLDLGENLSSGKEGALKDYFDYIRKAKESLKYWLKYYTKLHSKALGEGQCTRLESLAIKEVSRMIQFLRNKVNEVTSRSEKKTDDEGNLQLQAFSWLENFLKDKDVVRKLSNIKMDSSTFSGKLLTVDSFTKELMDGLDKLNLRMQGMFKEIKISGIDHRPYHVLEKRMLGCCKQCPFCGEGCDWGEHEDNIKHKVRQHRPNCLRGWTTSTTDEIKLSLCPVLVVGDQSFKDEIKGMTNFHPYHEYQQIYPDWSIPGDNSAKASFYWKWFVGKYHVEIAQHFGAKPAEVPESWKEFKWEDVKRDLKKQFNL